MDGYPVQWVRIDGETYANVLELAAACRAWKREHGSLDGDRVAGYLEDMAVSPETERYDIIDPEGGLA